MRFSLRALLGLVLVCALLSWLATWESTAEVGNGGRGCRFGRGIRGQYWHEWVQECDCTRGTSTCYTYRGMLCDECGRPWRKVSP